MSNLCWPNSAPQLPQFMGHPILVLRKQTCACPASGMSTRLTTPFIPGQISSQEIFHPELILLVCLYGRLHIMMHAYSIYLSCEGKLVHARQAGWAGGWQNLSYRHILFKTDLLFICLYGCVMMIEDTCWNAQYLSCESTLFLFVFLFFVCLFVSIIWGIPIYLFQSPSNVSLVSL